MKAVFFIIIVLLHFLSIWILMLFANFIPVVVVFLGSLTSGLVINYSNNLSNSLLKDLGWGLLYGSFSSFALGMLFIIWLTFIYPR